MLKQTTLYGRMAQDSRNKMEYLLQDMIPAILDLLQCDPVSRDYCILENYCAIKPLEKLTYPCRYFMVDIPFFLKFLKSYVLTKSADPKRSKKSLSMVNDALYHGVYSKFMPKDFRNSIMDAAAERTRTGLKGAGKIHTYKDIKKLMHAPKHLHYMNAEWPSTDGEVEDSLEEFRGTFIKIVEEDMRFAAVDILAEEYQKFSRMPMFAEEKNRKKDADLADMEPHIASSFPLTSFIDGNSPANRFMHLRRLGDALRGNIKSLSRRERELRSAISPVSGLMDIESNLMERLMRTDYRGVSDLAQDIRQSVSSGKKEIQSLGLGKTKWRFSDPQLVRWMVSADPEEVSSNVKRAWSLQAKRMELEAKLSQVERELKVDDLSLVITMVPAKENGFVARGYSDVGPLDSFLMNERFI
jgi:hypothetical protein